MASNDKHITAAKVNGGFNMSFEGKSLLTRFGVMDGVTFVKLLDRVLQTDIVREWYFNTLEILLSGKAKVDRPLLDKFFIICKSFADSFDTTVFDEYVSDTGKFIATRQDVYNAFYLATFVKLMAPIINSGTIVCPEKVATASLEYMCEVNGTQDFMLRLRKFISVGVTKIFNMNKSAAFSLASIDDVTLFMYDQILSVCLSMYDYDVDPFSRIGSKVKLKGFNMLCSMSNMYMLRNGSMNHEFTINKRGNIKDRLFSEMAYRYAGTCVTKKYLAKGEHKIDVVSPLDRTLYSMLVMPMYNDIFGLNTDISVYNDTQLKMIQLFLAMSIDEYMAGKKTDDAAIMNVMRNVLMNIPVSKEGMKIVSLYNYVDMFNVVTLDTPCDDIELNIDDRTFKKNRAYLKNYKIYGIHDYSSVIDYALTLTNVIKDANMKSIFSEGLATSYDNDDVLFDAIFAFTGGILGNDVKAYDSLKSYIRTRRRLIDKG